VPVIEIRVLGPLEVSVDGAPIAVGGPRQRCVLARLTAARGQVVSVDRLIEDLYADEAPPRALAAVQSYVSHLRRALEPDRAGWARAGVLIASPPGYALRLDPGAVDAWVFEDEVHQAAALADPATVQARLSAVLASWRGTAFQEFDGMSWADLEASRLEELRLTAIELRASAALRLGQAAQLVADLDKLTATHPLREESWRLLSLALYQSGRQGDSLAALRRARAKLATDLGVDPGPALRDLERDILAQAPQLTAPPVAGSPPVPAGSPSGPPAGPSAAVPLPRAAREAAPGDRVPSAAAPYVGRDAELAQALDAAAQAAAGRARIALVTGDAGAGKTALADQASKRLAAEGWTVTAGRCPEQDGAPQGWPWAQALRQLAGVTRPADPGPLAALLTDAPPPGSDAAAARFRLHQAVAGYLAEASRSAPLLVVLDDLHRADSETLAILSDVTQDLAAGRLLVLGTYRPAEVSEQLSGCLATLADREPVRITLRGLDAAAAGELVEATCGRAVADQTMRTIAERTGGNPFFIKETARLLDSEGALAAATEVPAGVREVLQRRIGRLPATAQTVLSVAAVIGTEVDAGVLAEVAGVGEHVLLDAVDAGLIAGLVTEPAAGRIRFAHALVRDTLYQGLSRLRRSRLHARAAAAIERHQPGEVAALAHHLTEAGTDPVKAARFCALTARQAEQRFAYHEAARLWERAIGCYDQAAGAPVTDRLEPVLGLLGVLPHAGQLAGARALRRSAVRAALPVDDPMLTARVITALDVPRAWFYREYGATDHELAQTVEQTLARLPPGDHPLRCRLLITLALELEGAESERGYQASAQALEMARRIGDPETLSMAISGRYLQCYRYDELAERQRLGAELLALPGRPVTVEALAHLVLMVLGGGVGDLGTADRHADEAARIAARYNLPTAIAPVTAYRAMRAALDGDLAGARELYDQAASEIGRLGLPGQQIGVVVVARSALLITQDRAADIPAELDGYPGAFAGLPELYALGLAAAGRVAEARQLAGRPVPIPRDRLWMFMTSLRGLLAIAIDDRELAGSVYRALLPFGDRFAGADAALITLGPVAQILGDLARYLGVPGAEAHYRQALALAERAHAGPWVAAAARRLGDRRP